MSVGKEAFLGSPGKQTRGFHFLSQSFQANACIVSLLEIKLHLLPSTTFSIHSSPYF